MSSTCFESARQLCPRQKVEQNVWAILQDNNVEFKETLSEDIYSKGSKFRAILTTPQSSTSHGVAVEKT